MTDSPFLELRGLYKSFGGPPVLEDLTLELAEGEVLALLGLSGSGKTTALRIIAGLETADRGSVVVDGDDVTTLAAAKRRFAMVFQHYALFPHMTVAENVSFGLRAQGARKQEIPTRVAEVLDAVDLAGFDQRKVTEISGGQQQRVALARALAIRPRLLLLDEPLSNLDPSLRERTRRELRAAIGKVGITTVLVTHEQEEAFDLGDRVAVLSNGRLEQVATAEELYRSPESRFVATFVGRANVLKGTVGSLGEGRAWVRFAARGDQAVSWAGVAPNGLELGGQVELVIRPEALEIVESERPGALEGRIVSRRFSGLVTYLSVATEGGLELEILERGERWYVDDEISVAPGPLAAVAIEPRVFPIIGSE